MGDDEKAAGAGRPSVLQVLRQPGDALDVEVVGGFVEEEDVVITDQELGQSHPATLAAAEVSDRVIPTDVGDESGDDIADPGVAGPLVVLRIADDGVADGLGLVKSVSLVEHADMHATAARHAPGVGLHPATQYRQERRLAIAVAADDADAVALVDADRHSVEDGFGREFEPD